MADITEQEIEAARAALDPTLQATAAILPLLGATRPPRFPEALNARWQAACRMLSDTWKTQGQTAPDSLRPAMLQLLEIALETADPDFLRLSEMLATAVDQLALGQGGARLIAALSTTTETLLDRDGLENPRLPERARHFAERIETALRLADDARRSAIIEALFLDDCAERLARMRESLEVLPIDAYALNLLAGEFAQQAEHLERDDIVLMIEQFRYCLGQLESAGESAQDEIALEIHAHLTLLGDALGLLDRVDLPPPGRLLP